MKTCTKCKIEKELSEFDKRKDTSSGYRNDCKQCRAAYNKSYSVKNAEVLSEQRRQYREANKDIIKIKKKDFYEVNRSAILEEKKEYYQSRREELVEQKRKYRENNPLKTKESAKKYYKKNEAIIRERSKKERNLPASFSTYASQLPPTDKPILHEDGVTLQVRCKQCKKLFSPTKTAVRNRIKTYSGKSRGEANFYCSDDCRESCPIHWAQAVPKNLRPRSKRIRACQTDHLKQLQCDEVGHHYCEKCGDLLGIQLHHTLPVAEGDAAITSAGHILLCVGCHTKLEATC